MRRASFVINGQPVNGHFALEKRAVGYMHQMLSGKWMIVDRVHDGKFRTEDGTGYFYILRPATDAEIQAHLNPATKGNVQSKLDAWMEEPEY